MQIIELVLNTRLESRKRVYHFTKIFEGEFPQSVEMKAALVSLIDGDMGSLGGPVCLLPNDDFSYLNDGYLIHSFLFLVMSVM